MIMEFDISKMVEKIAMQAKENQEEFIIETIHPYCENILQIKINKEELKQILLNDIQKQQPCEDSNTGHWIKMGEGFTPYECSECKAVEFKKSKYCPDCGAEMESEE